MKPKQKTLILCLAIPLLLGTISGLISMQGMESFEKVNKPNLSPPGWLFPVVWTILYILMGISSYLVLTSNNSSPEEKKQSLKIYGIQLLFNFFWSIWFFNFKLYFFAFIWLIVMWLLILATIVLFFRSSKLAAYLMIPYLAWVTFAGYLNLSIAILN